MIVDSGALLALLVVGAIGLALATRRWVTGVPLRMSLTRPGATRLHRRVRDDLARARRAVRRAERHGEPVHVAAAVLDDAARQAAALAARVVAASRMPFLTRQRELLALRMKAGELRAVTARLERLVAELVDPPPPLAPTVELQHRLDVLDAARRDAHTWSRRWGAAI